MDQQFSFLCELEATKEKTASLALTTRSYRIADIPIRKPKPYRPDPWDRLPQDFEDVNLAEERARIGNQRKKL